MNGLGKYSLQGKKRTQARVGAETHEKLKTKE